MQILQAFRGSKIDKICPVSKAEEDVPFLLPIAQSNGAVSFSPTLPQALWKQSTMPF